VDPPERHLQVSRPASEVADRVACPWGVLRPYPARPQGRTVVVGEDARPLTVAEQGKTDADSEVRDGSGRTPR
jgi:hypothetical protein